MENYLMKTLTEKGQWSDINTRQSRLKVLLEVERDIL